MYEVIKPPKQLIFINDINRVSNFPFPMRWRTGIEIEEGIRSSDTYDVVKNEIIAELKALIEGGGQITPELVNAYDALVVAMQALDDVIPNAP